MNAIDFSMNIDKDEYPKCNRVVITLNGKFMRYTINNYIAIVFSFSNCSRYGDKFLVSSCI